MIEKLAINQPEYWPLSRFLAKWAAADLLVVLDVAQFDRSSLQHRARMRSRFDGAYRWLTIPFAYHGGGTPQQIRVLEPVERSWALKHWSRLREWYRGADAGRLREVEGWFLREHDLPGRAISTYALESMLFLAELTSISTPYVLASALVPPPGGWGGKSDLVLNISRKVGARTYLSGVRGASYLDWSAFEHAGISIEVQAYRQAEDAAELSALHTYLEEGLPALLDLVARKDITDQVEPVEGAGDGE